jgi:hypothetical protein
MLQSILEQSRTVVFTGVQKGGRLNEQPERVLAPGEDACRATVEDIYSETYAGTPYFLTLQRDSTRGDLPSWVYRLDEWYEDTWHRRAGVAVLLNSSTLQINETQGVQTTLAGGHRLRLLRMSYGAEPFVQSDGHVAVASVEKRDEALLRGHTRVAHADDVRNRRLADDVRNRRLADDDGADLDDDYLRRWKGAGVVPDERKRQ